MLLLLSMVYCNMFGRGLSAEQFNLCVDLFGVVSMAGLYLAVIHIDNLKEFEYLWTTKKATTYLVKSKIGGYVIIEVINNTIMGLIIEDNDLHKKVVDRMLKENCKIASCIKSIPC